MNRNKLLLAAAAIMLPLGYAQAAPSDMNTGAAPPDQPAMTASDASGMPADAAVPADSRSGATADATAAASGTPVAVAKQDVTAGAAVLDTTGAAVGKVESVTADAAVISTGKARAQVPFTSLGKTDKGLVIAMSKSQFEAAAGKSAS